MSTKNLPTLKGVFAQPKAPPKRNFLKENKLKLKDLQKRISRKQEHNDNKSESSSRRLQQNRSLDTRSFSSGPNRTNSGFSYVSKKTYNSSSNMRQIEHCDKGIQTDDISDEIFLSNALKRCFSKADFETSQDLNNLSPVYTTEMQNEEYNSQDNDRIVFNSNRLQEESVRDSVATDLDFIHISTEDDNLPSIKSTKDSKKKQNRTVESLNLKNRIDLKLPKYLEREKREREMQQLREMQRDPHCPKGHYVLDDKERLKALKTAEKKFQELVNELNRMPMCSETLRIRSRKMEIEKALIELENTIRIFSKSKVYVKADN